MTFVSALHEVTRPAVASRVLATGLMAAAMVVAVGQAQSANKDIVDTAVAAGSFTTLAKALRAADLVDTLKGKGPFTVFAPTDAAFAKLPPGTLEDLLSRSDRHHWRCDSHKIWL